MKVINYLKKYGIEKLEAEFAIKVRHYDDRFTLNYNQIDSPKTHPITMECRGLILNYDFEVVSRSFDRFFNWDEAPEQSEAFSFKGAVLLEKCDGSLIKLYHYEGQWTFSTRGTAFAEAETALGTSFNDLVMETIEVDDLQDACKDLDTDITFIFEIISPKNRIVTPYKKSELVLLGSRYNTNGFYVHARQPIYIFANTRPAKEFKISTEEGLLEFVNDRGGLQEGVVAYDPLSGVRKKLKAEAYIAVHRLRGEGILTPRRIIDLVVTGETDEYLSYFPEDTPTIEPYLDKLDSLCHSMDCIWYETAEIVNQKQFALEVAHYNFSWALFKAKKLKTNPVEEFYKASVSLRNKTLASFLT